MSLVLIDVAGVRLNRLKKSAIRMTCCLISSWKSYETRRSTDSTSGVRISEMRWMSFGLDPGSVPCGERWLLNDPLVYSKYSLEAVEPVRYWKKVPAVNPWKLYEARSLSWCRTSSGKKPSKKWVMRGL